jgi:ABC-2 type transport system permease protein
MNILKQELKMGRKSLVVWGASLVGTLGLFMAMFLVIQDQVADFQKVFEAFPPEFRKALGITSTNLGEILGYFSFAFLYVLLAGSVQAMNLGVSVLSAEVRDKTGDFLYVKPIKRSKVITMKMLAVFIQIIIMNVVMIASSFIFIKLVSNQSFEFKNFLVMAGTLFMLQTFFAFLGLAVSVFLRRIRTVLPISMGVVFMFYIIYLLNQTLDDAKLAWLSPFGYFDLAYVSEHFAYQGKFVAAWLVLNVLFIFFTYKIFSKKDLPSI